MFFPSFSAFCPTPSYTLCRLKLFCVEEQQPRFSPHSQHFALLQLQGCGISKYFGLTRNGHAFALALNFVDRGRGNFLKVSYILKKILELLETIYRFALSKQLSYMLFIISFLIFLITPCFVVVGQACME